MESIIRTIIGNLCITVSEKIRKGKNVIEQGEELAAVLERIRGLLIEPERLTCSRCGATYDHERHGDTPILGQIQDVLQLVVADNNAHEAVFYCHKCKHLFIVAITGQYIHVIAE